MKTPLKTTFRNLDHSDTLVARIQEEADKLDKWLFRDFRVKWDKGFGAGGRKMQWSGSE